MAQVMDGKALAEKILESISAEIKTLSQASSLAVISVGANPASQKFIGEKQKIAERLGVAFKRYDYEPSISTSELRARIAAIVHEAEPTGIIIQLPLPENINARNILNAVPPVQDIDMLSARSFGSFSTGQSRMLPPVVGAVKALLEEYGVDHKNSYTVLVGAGLLVGKPLAAWLLNEKATFSMVRSNTPDISVFTKSADILISGVGKPGLISGDMIKAGATVIDAGTSEADGKLLGDVDAESVKKVAGRLTPVPGGVGPLTVAMLFQNLLTLAKAKKR